MSPARLIARLQGLTRSPSVSVRSTGGERFLSHGDSQKREGRHNEEHVAHSVSSHQHFIPGPFHGIPSLFADGKGRKRTESDSAGHCAILLPRRTGIHGRRGHEAILSTSKDANRI